ncbi:MAG: methylmalonyl Co-A mutase-associated GTPase MeaB [Myxococcales bacterium]|nr:methylmalonyl Co-A mutase-associated GTPase MeaB [Myxococcales bacterium]MCB9671781.1 methylmalonyl Co-A mutase-associated GTPase MeaB [Alphaproteobacteria bacterium]
MARPLPDTPTLVRGVLEGDRALLARAITLVESTLPAHQERAGEVLAQLMPHTGRAIRVGITGVPGVGKSTLIDTLGTHLTAAGHRVAVLAVDPSSTRTGGSILGDKTRMERLARDPHAYVRPSPTAGTLGGVANRTREALLLCEAAGYDVVLVETVGVGQSEIVVAGMTDTFVVLMLAGAGDALQGIKRGLMELADVLAVNKADGDNAVPARRAASTYRGALALLHPADAVWKPEVLTCSGLDEEGVDALWEAVLRHRAALDAHGLLEARRAEQRVAWMWRLVDERLRRRFREDPDVVHALERVEAGVRDGSLAPTRAAVELLGAYD